MPLDDPVRRDVMAALEHALRDAGERLEPLLHLLVPCDTNEGLFVARDRVVVAARERLLRGPPSLPCRLRLLTSASSASRKDGAACYATRRGSEAGGGTTT